ncbi:MAG TPA: hypothetical protein VGJ16_06335 [Pirellulales bacterium]|jgi:hypothetical protein
MAKLMWSAAALVILTTQTSYARYGDDCRCGAPSGRANTAATPMAAAPTYRTAQVDSRPMVGRTAYQSVGPAYGYAPYAAPNFGAGFRDEVNTHNYPDYPSRYSFGLRPASAKQNSNYAH